MTENWFTQQDLLAMTTPVSMQQIIKLMKITIKLLTSIFLLALNWIPWSSYGMTTGVNSDSVDNVKQVFTYIDQKNWSQAEDLALEVNSKVLTKIVLSQKYLDNKYSDNSFEHVIRFSRNNPDWPQNKLLEERAEEYLNNNTNKKVIFDWFSKHPPLTGKGYKFYAAAASEFNQRSEDITTYY
ncbi:MAG: hypothetical protein PG979_001175 [Rickettsia asembonensis]|nr:MAG: hypothetical protein PG979_001175 [Rickettsia asembonensis]